MANLSSNFLFYSIFDKYYKKLICEKLNFFIFKLHFFRKVYGLELHLKFQGDYHASQGRYDTSCGIFVLNGNH
ncbi:protein of unknown function [Legionella micdadei]|uniref:Uncharacterized protein n=1 Tax=Legionella micdadei TaxID=451 RepID=A0A098GEM4_LEGMI|nr:protein of unknown function [Legionella micdadei]